MAYDLAGKKVLVTGASSGIGAGLARRLRRGGRHGGNLRAPSGPARRGARATARSTRPTSRSWTIDLGDLEAASAFAAQADDELGGIDLLVNNAGVPKRRHALDLTPAVVEDVMRINYFSPVRITLALLPRMLARGTGRILTISSVAARLGPPREAAYSATKAGISAFMESLAVDLDGTDIRIHLVNPGIIDTELFHLPDNEPSLSDLEALPVETLVDAIRKQLDEDVFEIYVPEWFVDIVSGRYANIGPFIEGSRQYVRERIKQMETAE